MYGCPRLSPGNPSPFRGGRRSKCYTSNLTEMAHKVRGITQKFVLPIKMTQFPMFVEVKSHYGPEDPKFFNFSGANLLMACVRSNRRFWWQTSWDGIGKFQISTLTLHVTKKLNPMRQKFFQSVRNRSGGVF